MEIYTILDCFAIARNDGQRKPGLLRYLSQWRSKELGLLYFVRNDRQKSLMTLSTLYTSIHNKATD